MVRHGYDSSVGVADRRGGGASAAEGQSAVLGQV